MSGFATYTKKRQSYGPQYEHAAKVQRFRVVRFDGAVLGGSPDRDAAERLKRLICTGQRSDYAVVMGGGR